MAKQTSMKVKYKSDIVGLKASNALGDGGEANVIEHAGLAFKIYHEPSIERAQKIIDFINKGFSFPPEIMAPIDIVKNMNDDIVGFTMNIAKQCKDAMDLMKTDRSQQNITTNEIIKFLINGKKLLSNIHPQGAVFGDLTDLNMLYGVSSMLAYFIDVDTIQFDNHPCIVGTEDYLAPELYGIDLTKKPMFTKETDYYSFAVIMFRALLFAHPYAGFNKKFKTLFRRAENALWLYDSSVILPKVALHPETISDGLLEYFERVFCKKERIEIPTQDLEQLAGTFIECGKCGTYFTNTRKKCPQCQKIAPQSVDLSSIITNKTIGLEICSVKTLFGVEGTLLFTKVIHQSIAVIYYDGESTYFQYIRDGQLTDGKVKLWDGLESSVIYDFFSAYLVVYFTGQIIIFDMFDMKHAKPPVLYKTVTNNFQGQPVFTCSNDKLYRLTNTAVMAGKLHSSNGLLDQEVMPAIDGQTWITAGPNDLCFGYHKIFHKYQFFTLSKKGRYEIEMNDLPGQIIDMDVKISINSILLLRRNLDNGRTYSHLHIISDEGKILETRSEESLSSELLQNIYGKAFAGSNIIHPTDAGIATEKHGAISLKSSTANYVSNDNKLMLYKKGLLVISTNKISYLTLN